MEITISARHFTLPEPVKAHIESKLHHAFDDSPIKIMTATVVLDLEKVTRVQVDLLLTAKDFTFQSANTDHDASLAFDASLAKVVSQVQRALDKMKR